MAAAGDQVAGVIRAGVAIVAVGPPISSTDSAVAEVVAGARVFVVALRHVLDVDAGSGNSGVVRADIVVVARGQVARHDRGVYAPDLLDAGIRRAGIAIVAHDSSPTAADSGSTRVSVGPRIAIIARGVVVGEDATTGDLGVAGVRGARVVVGAHGRCPAHARSAVAGVVGGAGVGVVAPCCVVCEDTAGLGVTGVRGARVFVVTRSVVRHMHAPLDLVPRVVRARDPVVASQGDALRRIRVLVTDGQCSARPVARVVRHSSYREPAAELPELVGAGHQGARLAGNTITRVVVAAVAERGVTLLRRTLVRAARESEDREQRDQQDAAGQNSEQVLLHGSSSILPAFSAGVSKAPRPKTKSADP